MEELDESYQKVIELFSVCTNEDPKDRPSAAHIVEALELDVQWCCLWWSKHEAQLVCELLTQMHLFSYYDLQWLDSGSGLF